MVALFLDDNKTNNDGHGKEIGKKWYIYINKQAESITATVFYMACRIVNSISYSVYRTFNQPPHVWGPKIIIMNGNKTTTWCGSKGGSGRQSAPLKLKRSAPCTPGFCEQKKTYHQGGTHTGMVEGVGPPPRADCLQRVQNMCARLICNESKYCHITLLLVDVHWLPVKFRIEFKVQG